jgi:hypothetical protein
MRSATQQHSPTHSPTKRVGDLSACRSARAVGDVRRLVWRGGDAGDLELRPLPEQEQAARPRSSGSSGRAKADIPDYSMTSSARAETVGGTVRPRIFAVLRFSTSSNLVGCMTGRSAGFSPLRIRPTYHRPVATARPCSSRSSPARRPRRIHESSYMVGIR